MVQSKTYSITVEHAPKSVDLILDILSVLRQLLRIFSKRIPLLLRILLVAPIMARQLDEPHARTYKHIKVLSMLLHIRHSLYRASARANNSDTLILPCFGPVVIRPAGGMHDAAFEVVEAGDLGPFEPIEELRAVWLSIVPGTVWLMGHDLGRRQDLRQSRAVVDGTSPRTPYSARPSSLAA